jgi:hypothetical protein
MKYHVTENQLRHGTLPVAERWRFDFTSLVSFLLDWLAWPWSMMPTLYGCIQIIELHDRIRSVHFARCKAS